jgi:hypothetical protein
MHVSSGNFINTRSVSVDLDLEAGNYNISIKIEPSRAPYRTAESVIETEAPYRKQKLLQIGRNFELAHAKGKLREREQEARQQKKEEARRESRERQARLRPKPEKRDGKAELQRRKWLEKEVISSDELDMSLLLRHFLTLLCLPL